MEIGALPNLVEFVSSDDNLLAEQAVWALSNLAANSLEEKY